MRRLRFAACLVVTVALSGDLLAQADIVAQFEARSHTFNSLTLPYRLFVPTDYDSTRSYPIVLTLHGSGERGTNNSRHIEFHRIATSWADSVNQVNYPTFVVSPQAPRPGTWAAASCFGCVDTTPLSAELSVVMDLLDSLEVEFSLDPNRFYVTGLSMGGFGTWDLIARFPERFAAAIPMSGGGDASKAADMSGVAIWNFHGRVDGLVPAVLSQELMEAFEDIGRPVVYTDCDLDACGTIDPADFQLAMDSHADLLYTEYLNGAHVIWEESYDDPRLFPWVFAQYKQQPGAITITAPVDYAPVSGESIISWTANNPADSVEIWLLSDTAPIERISDFMPNTGSYVFNSADYADNALARVRLFIKNEDGIIYGRSSSNYFIIDNDGDTTPFVEIDDTNFGGAGGPVVDQLADLHFRASDAESPELSAGLYYSIDEGATFRLVEEFDVDRSASPQSKEVDLGSLPNSRSAVFRLEISDGDSVAISQTGPFAKQTPRDVNDYTEHPVGSGVATVTLHFVEPAALTGHRYQITFDDTTPEQKTYSVRDVDVDNVVLSNIPLSDGVTESPVFDGIRLVVQDVMRGSVDLDNTGWTTGTSDLSISIEAGTVNLGGSNINLLGTQDDYTFTFTDTVEDTSQALYGLPARDMNFRVTAASDGLIRDILFKDSSLDGIPGPSDIVIILEDQSGQLLPAWQLSYSGDGTTVLPESGDSFLLTTQKGVTSEDVFEFLAVIGVSAERDGFVEMQLMQNFPNPFSEQTSIPFRLDRTSGVRLDFFDLLGRLVDRIDLGEVSQGGHQTVWRPAETLANGVYFYRLFVTPTDGSGAFDRVYQMSLVR